MRLSWVRFPHPALDLSVLRRSAPQRTAVSSYGARSWSYDRWIETVVLWFSDVEGSTGGWAASGTGMLRALERHDEILRESIGRHGGVEFKHSGDGLLVTFPTV